MLKSIIIGVVLMSSGCAGWSCFEKPQPCICDAVAYDEKCICPVNGGVPCFVPVDTRVNDAWEVQFVKSLCAPECIDGDGVKIPGC